MSGRHVVLGMHRTDTPEQYVVLGMHRTGTSVVAAILNALGVNMGDKMLGVRHGNPYGHFESIDFLEMNQDILAAAGGTWHHPPSQGEILEVGKDFDDLIRLAVEHYDENNEQWGWKDPRTCLTIPLYHKHLSNPKYIVTRRPYDDVAMSLLERHEPVYELMPSHWYLDHWAQLIDRYNRDMCGFLRAERIRYLEVQFNALMNRYTAHKVINDIADFVGAKNQAVRKAFNQVRFRP